jgi:hypothetical protein
MEEKDSLASELLHLVKTQARRWFIAFIVVLIMLFATNLAWLYAWNLPSEESTSESYDIQSEDLHISYDYARQLSRKVNKKILKVL